ncbi:MAG: hypothetical protein CME06_06775 [Gemmatimonadetes bacterium]|nr:hypothetical protein [Gemmatimonadota bacterium]
MEGLRKSLRLLSLAASEHRSAAGGFWKFLASKALTENELTLQQVRQEASRRRGALAPLKKAERRRRAKQKEAEAGLQVFLGAGNATLPRSESTLCSHGLQIDSNPRGSPELRKSEGLKADY